MPKTKKLPVLGHLGVIQWAYETGDSEREHIWWGPPNANMAETMPVKGPRRMSVNGLAKAHYKPPWAHMSIIGIAGASGSGKTSLAVEVVKSLDLPWVIILSIVGILRVNDPNAC